MNQGYAIRQLQAQTVTPSTAHIPSPTKRRTWRHKRAPPPPKALPPKPVSQPIRELDGFIMLESTGMGFPEDGKRAVIPGKGYNKVVVEDLNFFVNLSFLDVSDNLLDFRDFEEMESLLELRMSCNYIEHIFTVQGYSQLQYLDMSYNRLTGESVLALSALPVLRELDLTGNELGMLPPGMASFKVLERIVLEHNRLDDNNVFFELCQMPNLRDACLAYNLLSYVPSQACSEGYFKVLELMDITYNYVASQSAIEPFLECPRLLKLLVYGNPLLGSSGDDSLGIYVEELVESAFLARDGYSLPPLEIVTEAPKKRYLRRGGFKSSRHSMYKDFSIEEVDSEAQTLKKTSRQYKMEGNKTLFAQAVDAARSSKPSGPVFDFDDGSSAANFFITSVQSETNQKKSSVIGVTRNDHVADEVMGHIAQDMNLNNSSDIRQLRDKIGGKYKRDGENEDERVPHDLFSRSMTDSQTLKTYPVSLNTAIKSLRYALQFPLTNDDEVPASSLFPAKHHHKKTLISEIRQQPRLEDGVPVKITNVEEKLQAAKQKKKDAAEAAKAEASGKKINKKNTKRSNVSKQGDRAKSKSSSRNDKPFLETVNDKKKMYSDDKRLQNNASFKSTMDKIEDVLDGLNKNTVEISQRTGGQNQDWSSYKSMARPNTGVKGLIDMVNNVVDELGK